MKFRSLILPLIFLSTFIYAQEETEPIKDLKISNKGRAYVFWGWNRGWYSTSDIRFRGDDYDFILTDVHANDRQSPFSFGLYFNPSTITIPQTNLRIGYFISDKVDISVGVDHMKYVMVANQNSEITGQISNETRFDGTYSHTPFIISEDFLKYEHTDGLNYLNAEITYNENLLTLLKIKSNPKYVQLDVLAGMGIGAMMPKSNVTLMDNARNDKFHFAGYGLAPKVGLNLMLFQHLFFRSEYKAGYIHLIDVRTTPFESDRARQHFLFTELNFVFGLTMHLK